MSASVGQKLRQVRQEKEISLEKISRDTYIRLAYLQAIEAGRLDDFPSETHARGYLRTYATYLGLDPVPLLLALRNKEALLEDTPPKAPAPTTTGKNQDNTTENINREIGLSLRKQRELLGFTLGEIENQTRIKLHYLEALEAGNMEAMPSPVQARGMLNNYTAFLGLNPDQLLLKYAEGLQVNLAARRAETTREPRRGSRSLAPAFIRRIISADLVFGVTAVVLLLTFVIWNAVQISRLNAAAGVVETAPPLSGLLIPSETPRPTNTATPEPPQEGIGTGNGPGTGEEPAAETALPQIIIPTVSGAQVQVYIVARQRAWLRVLVDEQVEFEGRVIPGSAYSFSGRNSVELLTGNAAGLQVFYNQQELSSLGSFGEVAARVFTPDGAFNPVPTATPIPQPTEIPVPEAEGAETPAP